MLCVSVVQSGTVTVIEGEFTTETQRTQRRPIEIEPIWATYSTPHSPVPRMFPLDIEEAFLCVLCVSVVQFGTVTVIDGIHHRDAENTEKTNSNRADSGQSVPRHTRRSIACYCSVLKSPSLCALCLCGSIPDDDCHRGEFTTETQSAQRSPG